MLAKSSKERGENKESVVSQKLGKENVSGKKK